MNLNNLANEYFNTSDKIEKKIEDLKIRLETARGLESILLSKRIIELSKQKFDLCNTGNYLKNYYLS